MARPNMISAIHEREGRGAAGKTTSGVSKGPKQFEEGVQNQLSRFKNGK